MITETNAKEQIHEMIESLPVERLPDLLRVVKQFLHPPKAGKISDTAPIYQIHLHAVDTGIRDLAAQHDHYLYGTGKRNA